MDLGDAPIPALAVRTRRAAQDIAEALSLMRVEQPQQAPGPGQPPGPAPQPMPQPAGGPQRPPMPPGGGMPAQRPAMSPLAGIPAFKSPPVAAALQGAVGREGPIGFAAGGRVDFAVRR